MSYLNFQTSVFYNFNYFLSLPTNKKLYELFQNLDLSLFQDRNYGLGQTGYSRHAMIRALIVKNIVQLKSIPRLITYLKDNPFVCDLCGFDSYRIPDETQFYRLLHSLDTDKIHQLLVNINNQYYDISHTSIRNVSIDSKPVLAPTRENNPKYHQRNLTNKNKQPKHNPDATLRYYATHIEYTEEKITDFRWGYRTHSIIDNATGCTLVEITVPINLPDNEIAKIIFKELKNNYDLSELRNIFGDKAYDDKKLKKFIRKLLKSSLKRPQDLDFIIRKNFRNSRCHTPAINGIPCPGNLMMRFNGLTPVNKKGTKYRMKFRCPLAVLNLDEPCPINHPALTEGKHYGCIKYITITAEQAKIIRALIEDNKLKKSKPGRIRVKIERYFSRLQDITSEDAPYYSLKSVRNHVAPAHLSLSLVALTALKLGRPDKINSYLTFAA